MRLRTTFVAILLTCAAAETAGAQGFDFPPEQRQNMVARLHVQVADQPDAPGFARVRLTVQIEGPPTLEVLAPLLGDATDAWKPDRLSAYQRNENGVVWSETLELRQVKPGLVPIPSLKVRFRAGEVGDSAAEWQEVEWTNILSEVRDLQLPVSPTPAASFGSWQLWTGVAVFCTALLGAVLLWKRKRKKPRPGPCLEERALRELLLLEMRLDGAGFDPSAYSWDLSALLRRYLAERFALPAPRQTTAEFLHSLQETKLADLQRESLRNFLERCDLIKYAGVSPTVDESRKMAEFVRAFIRTTTQMPLAA